MRRISLLSSVAAVPLLLAAAPAFAQSNSQEQPVEDADGDTSTDEETGNEGQSVIVVEGLRASLETAQDIKRNSDSIMDVVVAEDIGKLPDDTAAETIARIAGVQVTRFSDEANGVLIRGLPDVATAYNGREIFTAELRRVQLQDFPAQAISSIEVYKSGTADIIEPGLAGLVNVNTRRPFDFKGRVVAGGLRGTYNDQSDKIDYGGNVLVSDRWDVGDGEMGFLANATYAQAQYYNGARYNSTWIRDSYWSDIGTQGNNIRNNPDAGFFFYPNNIGLYNDGGKRFRPSANFSLQWAPNSSSEYYLEGLYQGYRGRGYADNFDIPLELWGPDGNPPVFTNIVLVEGTDDQAASFTKSSGADPQGYRSTTQDQTDTYQIAAGAKWEAGRAALSTDFAYSWSRYNRDNYSVDFRTVGAREVDVSFDTDGGVAFNFPNWDPFDPNNYIFRGYYEATFDVKGEGWQWRADLDLDTDWDFVHTLQFGLRMTDRSSQLVKNGSRYADVSAAMIPYGNVPIGELMPTINPFRGNAQGFVSYLNFGRNAIYDNRADLREFTVATLNGLIAQFPNEQYFVDRLAEFSTDEIQISPTQNWQATEQTYAAYAQARYAFNVGSVDVDGLVGLRAVVTDGNSTGTGVVCIRDNNGTPNDVTDDTCDSTFTTRTEKQNYVDFLPNVSMRIKFTPEIQLRLGYTQTRTKPDFGSLNPALTIQPVFYAPCGDPMDADYDPGDTTSCRNPGQTYPDYTGGSGNPGLKPFTSTNYDVSLEWYFSKTGFVSVAGFRRDIFGFFRNFNRFRTLEPYGTIQLSNPINAADAKIEGFEVNFQTFFDFLPSPLNGFGVQANTTYLKGKDRYPTGYDPELDEFTGEGEYLEILGLSKWTYNIAVFYEKGPLTTRLSYNKRSAWVNGYNTDPNTGEDYTGNGTKARDRLDFGISYDITKNFTLSADVSNILAKPFNNFTGYAPDRTYPIDVRDEGRYYGFGLRFRFGE